MLWITSPKGATSYSSGREPRGDRDPGYEMDEPQRGQIV